MSTQPGSEPVEPEASLYDQAETAMAAALQNLVYNAGLSTGQHAAEGAGVVTSSAVKAAIAPALLPIFFLLLAGVYRGKDFPASDVEDAVGEAARIATEHLNTAAKPLRDNFYDERQRIQEGGKDVRETSVERATRIAITSAAGKMRHKAAVKQNLGKKRWNTQRDSRVRADHIYLEGMRVSLDSHFITQPSGYKLLHPGDQSAPYPAWVGCRCFLTYSR